MAINYFFLILLCVSIGALFGIFIMSLFQINKGFDRAKEELIKQKYGECEMNEQIE